MLSCWQINKKLGVPEDGEFSKVIRYLRATNKVIATERLYLSDEITITPEGIDFLTELKLIQSNENRDKIWVWSTAAIAFFAFVSLVVSLLNYFK